MLLAIFCAAHSVLARTRVKQWTRRFVPRPLERATYCLVFAVLLVGLCLAWQPVPQVMWRITSPAGVAAILALFVLAWVAHFAAIFWMNYAEFFGLRQCWLAAHGKEYRPPTPLNRRDFAISHTMLVVSLMAIPWFTPVMSLGQLYFCSFLVLYDVIGSWLAHRDAGAPEIRLKRRYDFLRHLARRPHSRAANPQTPRTRHVRIHH